MFAIASPFCGYFTRTGLQDIHGTFRPFLWARRLFPAGRSPAFYDTFMAGPLPYQPGKAEPPVDQGDDLVLDSPRFPGGQGKTCISPAGPVTGHATVRRNVV
jgi:hypothetical protein